jgi:chromosome segregation ATPase
MNWWQQPFVQVALPIIVTFAIATLYQGKRIDDLRDSLNRRIDGLDNRLDAIDRRLERIENLLTDHDRRITTLEERTSPLHR